MSLPYGAPVRLVGGRGLKRQPLAAEHIPAYLLGNNRDQGRVNGPLGVPHSVASTLCAPPQGVCVFLRETAEGI